MATLLNTLFRRASSLINIPLHNVTTQRSFFYLRPLITPSIQSSNVLCPQKINDALCLQPQLPVISQTCGFKVKLKLRKRCKDCYLVIRQERAYIMCPTHRRHKQMSMKKKLKYEWNIAHACQSKVRPW